MFPEEQLTSAKVAGFVSPSRDLLTPKEIEREICFSVNHPGSELRSGPFDFGLSADSLGGSGSP